MTDERDRLDTLLDEALDEYGRSEPRPGLENRVLASLRARPPLPWWIVLAGRPARLALATALGLAALAVTALLVTRIGTGTGSETRAASIPTPMLSTPGRPLSAPSGTGRAAATISPARAPAEAAALPAPRPARRGPPRHQSFPAASPLGEQERLLLRYVSEAPREEVETRAGFLDAPAPLPPLPDSTTET
jgi:hypothetical protein